MCHRLVAAGGAAGRRLARDADSNVDVSECVEREQCLWISGGVEVAINDR